MRWKVSKNDVLVFILFTNFTWSLFFILTSILFILGMIMKKKKNIIIRNHQMHLKCLKHLVMLHHHQEIVMDLRTIIILPHQIRIEIKNISKWIYYFNQTSILFLNRSSRHDRSRSRSPDRRRHDHRHRDDSSDRYKSHKHHRRSSSREDRHRHHHRSRSPDDRYRSDRRDRSWINS